MKNLRRLAFLALFSVFLSVPGCGTVTFPDVWAALKKCDNVSWQLATEVFGDLVEVVQGNPAGEADLLTLLAADTVGAVPCLLDFFEGQGGKVGAAATKMKTAHAADIAKDRARGGATSLRCPGDPTPKMGPTADSTKTKVRPSLPGDAETAERYAGAREGGMSPPAAIYKAVSGDRLPDASPAAGGALRVPVAGPKGFSYPGPSVEAEQKNCFRECGDNVDSIAPPGGCRCWRHVGSAWRWVAAR